MKNFVDFLYTLLIGVAVTLFVGLGIWTFYSGPKLPTQDYPNYSQIGPTGPTETQSKELEQQQTKYDQQFKKYDEANKKYEKKVSIIALAAAVIFFVLGLWLIGKNVIVGEGLALGGIFSSIYAAITGAISQFKPLVFISICLILAMSILIALSRTRTNKQPRFWLF